MKWVKLKIILSKRLIKENHAVCSKKLSKYVDVVDYIYQALIVLSVTSGGV